jgi:hypothetical protein
VRRSRELTLELKRCSELRGAVASWERVPPRSGLAAIEEGVEPKPPRVVLDALGRSRERLSSASTTCPVSASAIQKTRAARSAYPVAVSLEHAYRGVFRRLSVRGWDAIVAAVAIVALAGVFYANTMLASRVIDGTRYFWLDDDMMISMRYARNLAEGQGLVWNAGERVDGYTNFLWTMVMAAVHLTGVADARAALLLRGVGFGLLAASYVLPSTAPHLRRAELRGVSALAPGDADVPRHDTLVGLGVRDSAAHVPEPAVPRASSRRYSA